MAMWRARGVPCAICICIAAVMVATALASRALVSLPRPTGACAVGRNLRMVQSHDQTTLLTPDPTLKRMVLVWIWFPTDADADADADAARCGPMRLSAKGLFSDAPYTRNLALLAVLAATGVAHGPKKLAASAAALRTFFDAHVQHT